MGLCAKSFDTFCELVRKEKDKDTLARIVKRNVRKETEKLESFPGRNNIERWQNLLRQIDLSFPGKVEICYLDKDDSHDKVKNLLDNWKPSGGGKTYLSFVVYYWLHVERNGMIADKIDLEVFGKGFSEKFGAPVPSNEVDADVFIQNQKTRNAIEIVKGRVPPYSIDWSSKRSYEIHQDFAEPWCPEMVIVPSGRFKLGSDQEEYDRDSFESHGGETTIHSSFALGKFPITLFQFNHFANETGHTADRIYIWTNTGWEKRLGQDWNGPGFDQTDDHPAVGISFYDAVLYCDWLNGKLGKNLYRLPSEAEWEYACLAGSETAFSWSDNIHAHQARFDSRVPYTESDVPGGFDRGTTRVDEYEPNKWGFYQMHGNIWEWCADSWNDNHRGHFKNGSARKDGDSNRAVVKGGSWLSIGCKLRAAKRDYDGKKLRGDTVGFRIARTLSPNEA